VPADKLQDMRIGLHADLKKHLVDAEKENWTYCEEVRFQSSVAATLVHELTRAFWAFAQKRCWNCFKEEPWFSKTETRRTKPEIGESWEHWAFGTRVPTPGRVKMHAREELSNLFSMHQWSYVVATEDAPESRSALDAVQHDFVLPVEYINSRFLESTWANIARKGKVAGRPNHNDTVIVKHEPHKTKANNTWGSRACTIADYTYQELIAMGGLQGSRTNKVRVYGAHWATENEAMKTKRELMAERRAKKAKEARKAAMAGKQAKNVLKMPERAARIEVAKKTTRRARAR